MSRADALRRLATDPGASEAERAAARRVLTRELDAQPEAWAWIPTSTPAREQLVLYAARHHGAAARLKVTRSGKASKSGLMVLGSRSVVDATSATVRRLAADVDRVALEAAVGFLAGALPVQRAEGDTVASSGVTWSAYAAGAALNPAERLTGPVGGSVSDPTKEAP